MSKRSKTRGATPKLICMNLSPKYIPGWDGWSAFREILSNAIDAGNPKITWLDDNTVQVESDGEIPIESMLLIGHGTKTTEGSTIGQFGEGLKMAALVAARSGFMTIRTGTSYVEFLLDTSHYSGEEKVLHACVTPETIKVQRSTIILSIPELKAVCQGMYLEDSKIRGFKNDDPLGKLFSQGIYVSSSVDNKNFFMSWNIPKIALDRDRKMVLDNALIRKHIQAIFINDLDEEDVVRLLELDTNDRFESSVLATYMYFYTSDRNDKRYDRLLRIVESWFNRTHGRPDPKMLMVPTTDCDLYGRRINRATRHGYHVVKVGPIAHKFLQGYVESIFNVDLPMIERTPSEESLRILDILRKFCDEMETKWSFSVVDETELSGIESETHNGQYRLLISTKCFEPGRFNETLQIAFEKMRQTCYYDVDKAMAKLAKIAFSH
jgi:hypothetical protein